MPKLPPKQRFRGLTFARCRDCHKDPHKGEFAERVKESVEVIETAQPEHEKKAARAEAKAAKNWAIADAVRNRLGELGIQLKDNKDGTTSWELKPEAVAAT